MYQRIVADAHSLDRAGTEVLDYDVGRRDHSLEDFNAARFIQVEDNRALVAVGDGEGGGHAAFAPAHRAREIADAGRFDLDDVGALVGEDHRRHRARDHLGEIDYADAVERSGHRGCPPAAGELSALPIVYAESGEQSGPLR